GRASSLSGGGRVVSWGVRPVRPDDLVRPGGPDPAGRGLRDQRLRIDAPDRGDGPAGRQRVRADGPHLDRAVWPAGRGCPGRLALLAMLPAPTSGVPEWTRLYERSHRGDGH